MKKIWHDKAWSEYLYWQTQDKKTLKRINELVKDIERNGILNGIGKPEESHHRDHQNDGDLHDGQRPGKDERQPAQHGGHAEEDHGKRIHPDKILEFQALTS